MSEMSKVIRATESEAWRREKQAAGGERSTTLSCATPESFEAERVALYARILVLRYEVMLYRSLVWELLKADR
jgi:hypothetical protein